MLCPRHRRAVTNTEHGQVFCLRCFAEAKLRAQLVQRERLIRRLQGR